MQPYVIDVDSHITEPLDLWTSRVPERFKDAMPRSVRTDDGQDVWMIDDKVIFSSGLTAPAGWPTWPQDYPRTIDECHPASYDPTARLQYMDEYGIWAQVLYPNVGGFGSQEFLQIPDAEAKLCAVRAYNDFLRDFSSVDARRLLPVLSIPFWDVEATVAEVERCASFARGILFTGEPQRFGLPFLGDPAWDPLWSVAEQLDIPIHFHIGGGESEGYAEYVARSQVHGAAAAETHIAVHMFLKNGVQCADLVLSGVLQRHPALNFVSVESGTGWLPFMLEAADYTYLGATSKGRARTSDLLPSELFARQVYCTYWFEQVTPTRLLDDLPVDNVLFETDFPHTACLYAEDIATTIDHGLRHAPAEIRRKFLWDNAARLYHIDPPGDTVAGTAT